MSRRSDPRKIRQTLAHSETARGIQTLGEQQVHGRLGFMQGGIYMALFRFVPFPVLMLLPFISQDIRNAWRTRQDAKETGEDLSDRRPLDEDLSDASLPSAPFLYGRYACTQGNPLACGTLCDIPDILAPDSASDTANTPKCTTCGFPSPLEPEAEILGRRGRYRISQLIGYRGLGRLYRATHLQTDQPVIIKEYVLPAQYFNDPEQQQIKELFETVAGLNLADGRTPDFRLMSPWEAIADRHEERCYVVVKGAVDSYPTLRHHLHRKGSFDPAEVRLVLDQVLQTLESLHCQKFVMPTGHIRTGLAHGNVNLDSLLILPDSFGFFERSQLLVYLRDLSLWEHIFSPPPPPPPNPPPPRPPSSPKPPAPVVISSPSVVSRSISSLDAGPMTKHNPSILATPTTGPMKTLP